MGNNSEFYFSYSCGYRFFAKRCFASVFSCLKSLVTTGGAFAIIALALYRNNPAKKRNLPLVAYQTIPDGYVFTMCSLCCRNSDISVHITLKCNKTATDPSQQFSEDDSCWDSRAGNIVSCFSVFSFFGIYFYKIKVRQHE